MKGTEHFKQAIKSYLDGRAKTDELFAVAYAKENKNLDDCITFILNQVKAMANEGCVGMADDDVGRESRGTAEGYQPIPSRGTAQDAATQEQVGGKTTGGQTNRT